MAILPNPEGSKGVLGSIKGALGLFGDTNKEYGLIGNEEPKPEDEYTSKLSDEEIVEMISSWRQDWMVYVKDIKSSQDKSYDYWIGKQVTDEMQMSTDNRMTDNLIFEAVETFLPIATRANPEAMVTCDESEQGQDLAYLVRTALVQEADTQQLRRKLARITRKWVLDRLGCVKISWDSDNDCIKTEVKNVKRMILDPNGHVDEKGHFCGDYIGDPKKISASDLMDMFPEKKEYIFLKAGKRKGTKLEIWEWWYKDLDVFFTLDNEVLGKFKNPHWNYDGTEIRQNETGEDVEEEVRGTNHFDSPMAPYLFLSVFSTGEHPHDDTSLIVQNIPIQDIINRRWKQIDHNVEGMNNGMIASGQFFNEEQAAQAASALRRGAALFQPTGKAGDGISRIPTPGLPNDVYTNLKDARQELRNIFGTSGSSPEGIKSTENVRGKILINQMDSSRIGGGVTEYIEQLADSIYNYWVQMMFVYYDREHFISDATNGKESGVLINSKFVGITSLKVTVKEGSLIPKDPLTQRNEAIDLWSANALDPRTLFKRLDFPDPDEATKQLILWMQVRDGKLDPTMYVKDFPSPQPVNSSEQVPGTGTEAVNPLGMPAQQQTPQPGTQTGEEAQSQQLLQSIPV